MTWSDEHYRILGLDPALEPTADLLLSMVHPDDRPAVAQAWAGRDRQGAAVRPRVPNHPRRLGGAVRPSPSDPRAGRTRHRQQADRHADGRHRADRGRPRAARRPRPASRSASSRRRSARRSSISTESAAARESGGLCASSDGRRSCWSAGGGRSTPTRTRCRSGRPCWSRVAAGHDTYADERRYLRPDGASCGRRPTSASCATSRGTPQYFFTQLQDITERKQMEARRSPTRRCTTRSPGCRTGRCSPTGWSTAWPAPGGAARSSA